MRRELTTAAVSAAAAFALAGCGVFGGGADYRLADQLERIPDPREDAETADSTGGGPFSQPADESEAGSGQDSVGVSIRAANYDRLAELTGEDKPPAPNMNIGSDESQDGVEAYQDWLRSVHSGAQADYQAEQSTLIRFLDQR